MPGIEIDRKRIITSDEAIASARGARSRSRSWAAARSAWSSRRSSAASAATSRSSSCCRASCPVEDEAVSAELEKSFRKQGITCHTGAKVTSAQGERRRRRRRGAARRRHVADDLRADYLLVATGRGPVTTGLDAERRRPAAGEGLHQGRRAVPDERARHLRDRRRHHARHARPSAARARLVGRRHRRRRADRRAGRRGRSTTTTCRAAPTAIRKSAASA